MSITVGTDTYISVIDADTYMANSYVSTSTEFTTWDVLSDGDKEIHLKNATKRLDRQMLRGVKAVDSQTLEFPRAIQSSCCNGNYYNRNVVGAQPYYFNNCYYVAETEVSQSVKDAEVEEAMTLSVEGSSISHRQKLQQQGVKEFTIDDLTEKYGSGLSSSYNSTKLISITAKELLKYYLAGSTRISC
jgi:hypothetical protein